MRYFIVQQIVRTEGTEKPCDEDIIFFADSDKWEITEVQIPKRQP